MAPPAGERLELSGGLEVPLEEIHLRTSRSSGPGGQHANVTASRVEAVFDIAASRALPDDARRRLLARFGDQVRAVAQDHRSQLRNRALALHRLRTRLDAALHVAAPRRPTRPTLASRQARLTAKRRRGARKRERRWTGTGDA